jgi:hypothetical protein
MTKLTKVDSRVLIVYHFYEKDQSYIDNFSHFIRFAYRSDLDYLIVVAGHHTIELPQASNIIYLFSANRNFDFGGYALTINTFQIDKAYEYYVFVNSSVRGPFLPTYCSKNWVDNLIYHFDRDVGIVGTAISITPLHHAIAKLYYEKYGYSDRKILSHVQSTCYVLPQAVLSILIASGFYEASHDLSKNETVRDYEIRLSQIILDHDLNLKCLLPEYNNYDYRSLSHDINSFSREGDSGFDGTYFGRTVHPYETMFIKTSRNTFSDDYLCQLANSMAFQFPVNRNISSVNTIERYSQHFENIVRDYKNFKRSHWDFWKKVFQLKV